MVVSWEEEKKMKVTGRTAQLESLSEAESNGRFERRGMHHSSCRKRIAYRRLPGIIHRNS